MPILPTPEPTITARAAEFIPGQGLVTQIAPMNVNSPINQQFVETQYITDAAITTPKVNDLAVTTGKVASDAITDAKVDNTSISKARAYRNAAQTIVHGVTSKVAFNAETYDTKGEFDSSSNSRFTAISTRQYSTKAQCIFVIGVFASIDLTIFVYKNGVEHSRKAVTYGGAGWGFGSVGIDTSDSVSLTANDYIEIFILQTNDSGSNLNLQSGSNYTFVTVDEKV